MPRDAEVWELLRRARGLQEERRVEEASSLAVEALSLGERRHGDEAAAVADVLEHLSDIYAARGPEGLAEAAAAAERALRLRRRASTCAAEDPVVASAMISFAARLRACGRLEEASRVYREAEVLLALGRSNEALTHFIVARDTWLAVARDEGRAASSLADEEEKWVGIARAALEADA